MIEFSLWIDRKSRLLVRNTKWPASSPHLQTFQAFGSWANYGNQFRKFRREPSTLSQPSRIAPTQHKYPLALSNTLQPSKTFELI